jgi:hypothetical protein
MAKFMTNLRPDQPGVWGKMKQTGGAGNRPAAQCVLVGAIKKFLC